MSNSIPNKVAQTDLNTWYLFPSTDTTAIYSFVVAALIGVLIAVFSTWLAYWFGKRSFDLTNNSFQVTIKQIEASIKDSENNTQKAIQSNKDLIEHQLIVKKIELLARSIQKWMDEFRNGSSRYLETLRLHVGLHNKYLINDELALSDIHKSFELYQVYIESLGETKSQLNQAKLNLLLMLNPSEPIESEIIINFEKIDDWLEDVLCEYCANKKTIDYRGEDYKILSSEVESLINNVRILLKREYNKLNLNN